MTSDGAATVRCRVEGGVATVTFARPGKLNAFNEQMSAELCGVVHDLGAREDVRVVVLRGLGEHFMAGADVEMLQRWAVLDRKELRRVLQSLFTPTLLEELPQPVVAAVDGYALGMGFEVALGADLRVATTRARFGLPEVTLGLLPGAGGTQRLSRAIGSARAAEAMLLGSHLDAATALAWGLVNRLVEPEELDVALEGITTRLLGAERPVLARLKRCLVAGRWTDMRTGLAVERETFLEAVHSPEAAAGTSAFLGRRGMRRQFSHARPSRSTT